MSEKDENPGPASEPLLIGAKKMAEKLAIGKTLLLEMNSDGRLGPAPIKKFGNRTLWDVEEVADWVHQGCVNREEWQKMKEEGK